MFQTIFHEIGHSLITSKVIMLPIRSQQSLHYPSNHEQEYMAILKIKMLVLRKYIIYTCVAD